MSQKVAYVTGGMGGIGTAICQRLHKEGFPVSYTHLTLPTTPYV